MDGNVLGVDICQYFPPTESPYISFPHHHSILASQGVVNRDVLGLGISQYFTHSMCRRPKNAKAFDGATIYINFTKRNNLQALKKHKSKSSKTENCKCLSHFDATMSHKLMFLNLSFTTSLRVLQPLPESRNRSWSHHQNHHHDHNPSEWWTYLIIVNFCTSLHFLGI